MCVVVVVVAVCDLRVRLRVQHDYAYNHIYTHLYIHARTSIKTHKTTLYTQTCTCTTPRLEVVDDSAKHAGHAGSRMTANYSGETHFNVTIVSTAFEGLTAVKRHQKVYQV